MFRSLMHRRKQYSLSPYALHDTFTDSNGVGLDAHSPDVDSVGGGWTEVAGTWEIQDNKCQDTSATSGDLATINSGLADLQLDVDLVAKGSGANHRTIGAAFRYSDSTHFWWVVINASAEEFALYENDGGFTKRDSASVTIDDGTSYAISITANDEQIDATLDAGNDITYASAAFNKTQTTVGFRIGGAGSNPGSPTADNLIVQTL